MENKNVQLIASGYVNSLLLKMPIEIVDYMDLPTIDGDFP